MKATQSVINATFDVEQLGRKDVDNGLATNSGEYTVCGGLVVVDLLFCFVQKPSPAYQQRLSKRMHCTDRKLQQDAQSGFNGR